MAGLPSLPPRGSRKRRQIKRAVAAAAAVGAPVAAASWLWLINSVSKPARVWAGEGELKAKVLPHCSHLHRPYTPAPLALNTHVQNILGFIRGATIHTHYTRQLIIAHDGGTLALDWFDSCDAPSFASATTPILLVLHGINGGSHEGYCKWVCATAVEQQRWRAVVLNYRGCNGLPLTSPRGYAATLTHDIHYAITSIKARFPHAPLFAVGYSLGGIFLTKYLGEADAGLHASVAAASSAFEPFEGSGLRGAAVVSTPVCLSNSAKGLSVPWTAGYLYNMAVAYKLREFMSEHHEVIRTQAVLDLDRALRRWTVPAMEEMGIPNTFGFSNRQEYYEASSSLAYIPHIRTPTLFLVSEDDPFLGVLPDQECLANPYTVLAATEKGGHVAFLQGWWPLGRAYMDDVVVQFLATVQAQLPHGLSIPRSTAAATGALHAGSVVTSSIAPAVGGSISTAEVESTADAHDADQQQPQQPQQQDEGLLREGRKAWLEIRHIAQYLIAENSTATGADAQAEAGHSTAAAGSAGAGQTQDADQQGADALELAPDSTPDTVGLEEEQHIVEEEQHANELHCGAGSGQNYAAGDEQHAAGDGVGRLLQPNVQHNVATAGQAEVLDEGSTALPLQPIISAAGAQAGGEQLQAVHAGAEGEAEAEGSAAVLHMAPAAAQTMQAAAAAAVIVAPIIQQPAVLAQQRVVVPHSFLQSKL